jgi:hypothetical protein
MIGVVKPPRRHNEVSHLLVKGRENQPVYIDPHSPVLRLIQMIRDETHRTAVTYHRKRRELRDFTSELTAIPGVGDKRKTRLLRHFGSIQRVSNASLAELSPFVGKKPAADIVEHFTRQRALAESGIEDGAQADSSALINDSVLATEEVETGLVDPMGDAEDLQPIRSVDQNGELRKRRRRTRKPGERSTNPHAIKREKIGKENLAD